MELRGYNLEGVVRSAQTKLAVARNALIRLALKVFRSHTFDSKMAKKVGSVHLWRCTSPPKF
jgi:hypothetical protein